MTAPSFAPSDRIIDPGDPYEAWIVTAVEPRDMVRGTRQVLPGLSPITMLAPAEDFIPAPEGWEDAPVMPAGFLRAGLSYEADEAAREAESADLDHQLAMFRWHLAMAAWAAKWLCLVVDRAQANQARAGHLIQAECCQQQTEGLFALPVAAE